MVTAAEEFLCSALSGQNKNAKHTVRVATAIVTAAIDALNTVHSWQNGITKYADRSAVTISGSATYFP